MTGSLRMENLILWGTSKQILNAIETTLSAERDTIKILGVHQTDGPVSAGPDYLYFSVDDVLHHTDCPVFVCGISGDAAVLREITSLGIPRERLIPEACLLSLAISYSRYVALLRSRLSILSNDCWGGLTYHFFGLPFLSPTINLFFDDPEYLTFLENLDDMLQLIPEPCGTAYNMDERFEYPVFRIGSVRLFMKHCRNAEQGKKKWIERCRRINRDNLLVIMVTTLRSSAERFSRLPYAHKVCFVPFETDLPCCVYVDTHGKDLVKYVNSLASGERYLYDPLALVEQHVIHTTEVRIPGKNEIRETLEAAQHVLIYGARVLGHKACMMSAPVLGDRLCGFAVSDMKDNPETKDGLPVRTVSCWSEKMDSLGIAKDSVLVILALHPRYYGEVEASLKTYGFSRTLHLQALDSCFTPNSSV